MSDFALRRNFNMYLQYMFSQAYLLEAKRVPATPNPTTMSEPTISDHCGHDPERLDGLFQRFQTLKTTDRSEVIRSFQEFYAGLERHIVWEEEILFPAFKTKTGMTSGPTQVMRWEHAQIRDFLKIIAGKLATATDDSANDEAGLLSVLGPHNQKEENILYPMIDQATDGAERTQIFAEMEKHV